MKSRLTAAITLLLAAASFPGQADPLDEVGRLLSAGEPEASLRALLDLPRTDDVRYRFLLGTALAANGRSDEAIALFERLVADHPQAPEPYNNLAVLYLREGRLKEAQQMLERALRTSESYATVHENLSTVYVEMARTAYVKALQLEEGGGLPSLEMLLTLEQARPASNGLSLARSGDAPLTAGPAAQTANAPGPSTTGQMEDSLPMISVVDALPASEKATASEAPVLPPTTRAAVRNGENVAVVAARSVEGTAEAASGRGSALSDGPGEVQVIEGMLTQWAAAWAAQDVEAYLSYYATTFQPGGTQSRETWESERRERLSRPEAIVVELEAIQVELRGPQRAVVRLWQRYATKRYQDKTRKRIALIKVDGQWLIESEKSLQIVR